MTDEFEIKKFIYTGVMDHECVSLCNAINSISGLRTIESCSGHGIQQYRIWFTATDMKSLHILMSLLGSNVWECKVRWCNTSDEAFFMLESKYVYTNYGANQEVNNLVEAIKDYLQKKAA
jgi:hypothetical protein